MSVWHAEGNANDGFSGNAGQLKNGATTTTSGKLGSAFSFDGADDFVQVSHNATLNPGSGSFTAEAWIYQTGTGTYSNQAIPVIGKVDGDFDVGWGLFGASPIDGKAQFNIDAVAGGSSLSVTSAAAIPLTAWVHLAAVYDATAHTISLYVNGQFSNSAVANLGSINSSADLLIGKYRRLTLGRDEFFPGKIDEPAVYSRALSAAEIQATMSGVAYTQTAGSTTVSGTLTAGTEIISGGAVTVGTSTTNFSGAVSLWKGEGNANDSVDGNPGSFQNGASTTTAGKIGSALSFNGSSQYVLIPDSPSLRPTNLTMSAWVNFNSTPSGTQHFIAKTIGSSFYDSYVMWWAGGQFHSFVGNGSVGGSQVDYTFTPVAGTWYHVSFTFDDATDATAFYLDGVLRGTGSTR